MKRFRNIVCGALSFICGGIAFGCIVGATTTAEPNVPTLIVLAVMMGFGVCLFSKGVIQ